MTNIQPSIRYAIVKKAHRESRLFQRGQVYTEYMWFSDVAEATDWVNRVSKATYNVGFDIISASLVKKNS